jgi:hypothetical protein
MVNAAANPGKATMNGAQIVKIVYTQKLEMTAHSNVSQRVINLWIKIPVSAAADSSESDNDT